MRDKDRKPKIKKNSRGWPAIRVNPEVYKRFKLYCVANDATATDTATVVLEEFLATQKHGVIEATA